MSTAQQSLAIPAAVREAVRERDGDVCRLCGQTSNLILHHVHYGGDEVGMGGRRFHHVDNIVTLGGAYQHRCHDTVHSRKGLWVPVLEAVIAQPGVTGLQIKRWRGL